MQSDERVSLQNLGGGAAIELFDDALQLVLDNIQDPNTKPTAPREIVLKVNIRPDTDRQLASVNIAVVPKLSPVIPYNTRFYMGKNAEGNAEAHEHNPNQQPLFEKKDNVIRMVKNA